MSIVDTLFGRPLATEEEKAERIGPLKGIPIFGLDALSSAAYGPEAALTLLIPLGMAGSFFVWPITIGIVVLLGVVYFSYRQTIGAYPQGGGSYTVASENLGVGAGLLAAAALMIDYVLTAAVGISAGVGALVSAVPSLQSHTLNLCLAILLLITIINLRGVQETGGVFLLPTYVFIACLLGLIAVGVVKTLAAGGHPVAVAPIPKLAVVGGSVSAWLLLRAFSSGCTAMTGVEAVSNGVMAFRELNQDLGVHSARVVGRHERQVEGARNADRRVDRHQLVRWDDVADPFLDLVDELLRVLDPRTRRRPVMELHDARVGRREEVLADRREEAQADEHECREGPDGEPAVRDEQRHESAIRRLKARERPVASRVERV